MAEEANDIQVSDEAINAGFADDAPQIEEPATKPDAEGEAPAEQPAPAEEPKGEEDKGDDPKETDPAEDKPEGDEQPKDPSGDPEEEARKEEARQKFLERQQAKNQQKDEYIQKLEQDLQNKVDAEEDETKQRVAALEAREFLNGVKEARNGLVADNITIAREFPELDPGTAENPNPKYDKELHQDLLGQYSSEYLVSDSDGEIIGTKKGLHDFISKEMSRIARAAKRGEVEGQANEAKTRAKSTPQPSAAQPKSDKQDLWDKAFDEG